MSEHKQTLEWAKKRDSSHKNPHHSLITKFFWMYEHGKPIINYPSHILQNINLERHARKDFLRAACMNENKHLC
jgi:hypothetical protein